MEKENYLKNVAISALAFLVMLMGYGQNEPCGMKKFGKVKSSEYTIAQVDPSSLYLTNFNDVVVNSQSNLLITAGTSVSIGSSNLFVKGIGGYDGQNEGSATNLQTKIANLEAFENNIQDEFREKTNMVVYTTEISPWIHYEENGGQIFERRYEYYPSNNGWMTLDEPINELIFNENINKWILDAFIVDEYSVRTNDSAETALELDFNGYILTRKSITTTIPTNNRLATTNQIPHKASDIGALSNDYATLTNNASFKRAVNNVATTKRDKFDMDAYRRNSWNISIRWKQQVSGGSGMAGAAPAIVGTLTWDPSNEQWTCTSPDGYLRWNGTAWDFHYAYYDEPFECTINLPFSAVELDCSGSVDRGDWYGWITWNNDLITYSHLATTNQIPTKASDIGALENNYDSLTNNVVFSNAVNTVVSDGGSDDLKLSKRDKDDLDTYYSVGHAKSPFVPWVVNIGGYDLDFPFDGSDNKTNFVWRKELYGEEFSITLEFKNGVWELDGFCPEGPTYAGTTWDMKPYDAVKLTFTDGWTATRDEAYKDYIKEGDALATTNMLQGIKYSSREKLDLGLYEREGWNVFTGYSNTYNMKYNTTSNLWEYGNNILIWTDEGWHLKWATDVEIPIDHTISPIEYPYDTAHLHFYTNWDMVSSSVDLNWNNVYTNIPGKLVVENELVDIINKTRGDDSMRISLETSDEIKVAMKGLLRGLGYCIIGDNSTWYRYAGYNPWQIIDISGTISGTSSAPTTQIPRITYVEELEIGNSVNIIGSYALYNCNNLKSVIVPDSVTDIGTCAFYVCGVLKNVSLGNNISNIGTSAFSRCTELVNINIPESVTNIGAAAFYGCSKLASVTIPNNVKNIAYWGFEYCTSMTSLTISDSVESIGEDAFMGCENLAEVTIIANGGDPEIVKAKLITAGVSPDAVWNIHPNTIYKYTGDTSWRSVDIVGDLTGTSSSVPTTQIPNVGNVSEVVIGNTVSNIGQFAFAFCSNSLVKVTIPNSVTNIADGTFEGCTKLTTLTIGNGVKAIKGYAFDGCTGITSLVLPDTVETVGDYAFRNCNAIATVVITDNGGDADAVKSALISKGVPSGATWATEVAYAASTGSQYVDTGVVGKDGTKIWADMEWTEMPTDAIFIGSRKANTGSGAGKEFRFYPYNYWLNNGYGHRISYGHELYAIQNGETTGAVGERYKIESILDVLHQEINMYTNWVGAASSKQRLSGPVDTGLPMYLFAANAYGSPNYYCKCRVYGLKIWQKTDGVYILVRDYIPCSVGGGDIGLFDKVSGVISYY